jgi:hypothetical protein
MENQVSGDGPVDLGVKTYTPLLLAAGYCELEVPITWWEGRRLRFSFPPR